MNEPPTVTPVGVISPDIAIDSPEWFEWLAAQKSFHYRRTDSTNISSFTCTKRPNGRWYAVKKQRGSRENKQEYIGADQKCTRAKLDAIASLFALPNEEYWQLKEQQKQRSTGGTRAKVYNQEQLTSETGEEVSALKARISELEFQLSAVSKTAELAEHYQRDRDRLANLMADRDARHSEAMNELLDKVDQLQDKNLQLKQQLAEAEALREAANRKPTMPDLTGLKTYKLHKHDVVRIEDLVSLLEKHCGES
jgi:hypothetical protein